MASPPGKPDSCIVALLVMGGGLLTILTAGSQLARILL